MIAETAILTLGDAFYDVVEAATFPMHQLRFRNDRAAREVGLQQLSEKEWLAHFGRFEPLPGNLKEPLALRYHGHQFHSYNPDLGDGRGFLFAQLRDNRGRLMDLGTKGSGKTPWSRFGDGRLTLKGGVREVLAAEMLEALGVGTARAFSLVETGEQLVRHDEPSPTRSGVLVRLAHGHIRFGTFQRLAWFGLSAEMERLIRYVLQNLLQQSRSKDPYATLMEEVVRRMAQLVAEWSVAGFVHGVLNTDNMNVTGESFDYGPWRFLPRWDMEFTAAYFDQSGLYAFGRQTEAVYWNLVEFAKALRLVAPAESLLPALKRWPELATDALRRQFLWRLGIISNKDADDQALLKSFAAGLAASGEIPDAAWFRYRGGRLPETPQPAFQDFAARLKDYTARPEALAHPYWQGAGPETMLIDELEALWAPIAERDDWTPFHHKLAAIARLREAHAPMPSACAAG